MQQGNNSNLNSNNKPGASTNNRPTTSASVTQKDGVRMTVTSANNNPIPLGMLDYIKRTTFEERMSDYKGMNYSNPNQASSSESSASKSASSSTQKKSSSSSWQPRQYGGGGCGQGGGPKRTGPGQGHH